MSIVSHIGMMRGMVGERAPLRAHASKDLAVTAVLPYIEGGTHAGSSMTTGQVFSIGYGSQTQSEVLAHLTRAKITYVIDVRSSPFSRFQPEFSREPLSISLKDREIKYVFMGDLLGGRPKDNDCYTDGRVDYTKTRAKDFFRKGIERLKTAHSKGLNICMICSEGHPSQCHRSKLIGEALVEHGIEVTHILPDGGTKSQAEVIAQLTDGQSDMFGDQFLSRKTYR